MRAEVLYEGVRFTLSILKGTRADVDTELDTLTQNDPNEANKVTALIQFVGDNGPPRNEEKCRAVQGQKDLYELKAGRVRLCFFYYRGGIILTHLFLKSGGKAQNQEFKSAASWRDEFLRRHPERN